MRGGAFTPGSAAAEGARGEDDAALLRALVSRLQDDVHNGEDGARDYESDVDSATANATEKLRAFADMLEALLGGRYPELTEKQRAWATAEAERCGVEWQDPAERNRDVPRGREVGLAVNRMPRPLRPPGRRP